MSDTQEQTAGDLAKAVSAAVTGAVAGEQLDALRTHIGQSVASDPESMLQVHAELTAALADKLPSAPVAPSNINAAAEIHQHLDDMERTIADFGSAGGGVLSSMIDLIRSKLQS